MAAGSSDKAIGAYEVIQPLPGHTGEVYLARRRDRGTRRQYILVVFETSAEELSEIDIEVRRCKRLKHPAIAPVAELFQHQDKQVAVYECAAGASLDQLMRHLRRGQERFADRAAYYIGWQLCGALAELHTAKDNSGKVASLVHGQLGPHQVFLSWDGDVRIVGIGLSRVYRGAKLEGPQAESLRPFLSPEERGKVPATPRSNVYDAGAILWSLLTRKVPAIDQRKPEGLGTLRPELPRQVADSVDQALEPAVQQRLITCKELAKALEQADGVAGRQDLRFSMDVYRALARFEEVFLPPGEAPVAAEEPEPSTDRAEQRTPVSESDMPTGQWKIDHAALAAAVREDGEPSGEGKDSPDRAAPDPSSAAAPAPKAAPAQASGSSRRNTLPAPGQRTKSPVLGRVGLRAQTRRERKKTIVGIASRDGAIKSAAQDAPSAPVQAIAPMGGGDVAAAAAAAQVATAPAEATEPPRRDGAWTKSWVGALRPRRSVLSQSSVEVEMASAGGAADGAAVDGSTGSAGQASGAAPRAGRSALGGTAVMSAPDPGAEPRADSGADGAVGAFPSSTSARQEQHVTTGDFVEPDEEETASVSAADLAPPALPISIPPLSGSMAPLSSHFVATVPGSLSPDGMPISLVGQHATLSIQPPPAPASVSLKVIIAVAICSVVSFAAGMLIAQRPVDVRVTGAPYATSGPGEPTAGAASPQPPVASTATGEAKEDVPGPAPAESPATKEAPAEGKPRDGDDGSRLPESHGYLVVTTTAEDAHVYVNGQHLGDAGEKLMARCGILHVRVGTKPLTRWFGRGKAVSIACQGVTSVSFDRWMYDEQQSSVPKARRGWIPDGL